jgi:DNA-binding MarR family transcriptional regulator
MCDSYTYDDGMPRPSSSPTHTANVLGALSLVLADRMTTAVEGVTALGPSAAAALAALHEFLDGGSITRLCAVLGLTHSGTVRLVDRLVAEGLVDRRGSADGRAVSIALTRRGRRMAERVLRERRTSLDVALATLNATEIQHLSGLVDKMLTAITLERAKERATSTGRRPPPWLCRLCELDACGRAAGHCPVSNAVTAGVDPPAR